MHNFPLNVLFLHATAPAIAIRIINISVIVITHAQEVLHYHHQELELHLDHDESCHLKHENLLIVSKTQVSKPRWVH